MPIKNEIHRFARIMALSNNLAYLGTAMANPVQLTPNGDAVIVAGLAVINNSIMEIMSTPIGTRLFLPEFGSRLDELKFEPNDDVLKGMMRRFVFEALQLWETRVKFVDLDFDSEADLTDEGALMVTIQAQVLPSNEVKSFVFPFYRELIY